MAAAALRGARRRRSRRWQPAAFLDRDGVLNYSYERGGRLYAPRRRQDFRLLPGVRQAVSRLKRAGYLIVVVTNQPDIGVGLVRRAEVEAMHARLGEWLAPDAVEMCPHAQNAGCCCRKPRPGMLLRSAARLRIDLAQSVMIGDRDSDMIAGKAAGCYTIWIRRSVGGTAPLCTDVAFCLPAAVRLMLGRARRLRRRRGKK